MSRHRDKEKVREEEKELSIDRLDFDQMQSDDQPGVVSGYTCPDCHGALWELTESQRRYTDEGQLVSSRAKILRDLILSGILNDGPNSLTQL